MCQDVPGQEQRGCSPRPGGWSQGKLPTRGGGTWLSTHAVSPTRTGVGTGFTGGERSAEPSPSQSLLLALGSLFFGKQQSSRDADGSRQELDIGLNPAPAPWGHPSSSGRPRRGLSRTRCCRRPQKAAKHFHARSSTPFEDHLRSLGHCCRPSASSPEAASPIPGATRGCSTSSRHSRLQPSERKRRRGPKAKWVPLAPVPLLRSLLPG